MHDVGARSNYPHSIPGLVAAKRGFRPTGDFICYYTICALISPERGTAYRERLRPPIGNPRAMQSAAARLREIEITTL
jgi:hypothetical protein